MESLNLLSNIGNVTNKDCTISYLQSLSGKEPNVNKINKSSEIPENIEYYTAQLDKVDAGDEKSAQYCWVNSGLTSKVGREVVYISFYKNATGWEGCRVGVRSQLIKAVTAWNAGKDPKNNEETLNTLALDSFYTKMYDALLVKAGWEKNSRGDFPLLSYYVTALTERIIKGNTVDMFISTDKPYVVFNTGLLNTFGIFILILYNKEDMSMSIVESRSYLTDYGFSEKDIKRELQPITFWKDPTELIFTADMEDFDLGDKSRLVHLLDERKFRFPEEVRNLSSDTLYSRLESSIKMAVNISKRDTKYVVPMYSKEYDMIQHLIPFRLNASMDEKPEVVIIVSCFKSFYKVMTILKLEEAYKDARVVSPYFDNWLASM